MIGNFPTPHCHPSSFDSASTPAAFAEKELSLGSGHLTVTDHGTLEGCRTAYDLCRSKRFAGKLNPIIGMEAYVRDDNCAILEDAGVKKTVRYHNELTNARVTQKAYDKLSKADQQLCIPEYGFWEHIKYMHCTMHFLDQDAFFTAVKLLSKADLRAEKHGSERKPLFSWADLEELGSKNVTMTSSCLVGVVGRHLLSHDDWKTAAKYYQKLRSMVKPGNFLVEMFPHTCDKNWESGVWVKYVDDTEEKFPVWKKLRTDEGEIKAENLAQADIKKHKRILAVMQDRKWSEVAEPKEMMSVTLREGFIVNDCKDWSPDGDVQLGANRFIYQIAQKMGDTILVSDDSHFTTPDEKLVQDMRLAQSGGWRMANSYHRMDNAMAGAWFRDRMGIDQSEFEGWVQNNHDWATRFHDFKFTTQKTLPTNFYPADTLQHTAKLIAKHGRMIHDAAHLERLQKEIELLHKNGTIDLLPYFHMLEEVCDLYTRNGEWTGPGRGCLTADAYVLTHERGFVPINTVMVGDTVFSHTGAPRAVINRFEYDVHEDGIQLVTTYSLHPFALTKDHKVFGRRRSEVPNWSTYTKSAQQKMRRWSTPGPAEWIAAGELKYGDQIFVPNINRRTSVPPPIDMAPYVPTFGVDGTHLVHRKNGASHKNFCPDARTDRFFEFNEDTCYFLGRWIGDGWLTEKDNRVGVAFHSKDTLGIQRIANIVRRFCVADPTPQQHATKSLVQLYISSSALARAVRGLFPDYKNTSGTKYIPEILMHLPDPLLRSLVEGLADSDGSDETPKKGKGRIRNCIDTTSERLSENVKRALLFLGIPSSRLQRSPFMRGPYLCARSYKIRFKWAQAVATGFWVDVKGVSVVPLAKVYDLEVEEDHSFVTSEFAVHNSAAGVYLSYLLNITHLDPLEHELSLDRFLTPIRIASGKLPDIDEDLGDRGLLSGYEQPGLEVEFEDGSKVVVPVDHVFQTDMGPLTAQESIKRGANVVGNMSKM